MPLFCFPIPTAEASGEDPLVIHFSRIYLSANIFYPGEHAVISQTITDGVKPYAIGEKIRTLRLKKSMGLVELGEHTGLSAALLSKLERGNLFPTLPAPAADRIGFQCRP